MTGGGDDCDVEQPSSKAEGSGLVDCAECTSSRRRNCECESGDDMLRCSSVVAGEMVSMVGGLQRCRLHMHGDTEGQLSSVRCESKCGRERQRALYGHVAIQGVTV